jgi:hypothetical protein
VCFPFAHSEKECDVIFLLCASAPEIIQFPAALGVEVCESGEGGCTWGIFKLIISRGTNKERQMKVFGVTACRVPFHMQNRK